MTHHASILFSISTGTAEPIYRQLVDQVRRLVVAGQLAGGDDMPSVREVAQTLAVNPMTVSKAYSILEMEGLLERRRGMGMVVASVRKAEQSVEQRFELLRPTLERAAREARELELDPAATVALFERILKGLA